MSKPESELQQVVNHPVKVTAFGNTYEIQRFAMGKLIRALPHIAPLGYLMRSVTKADMTDMLVNSLALGGEPALGLISVAIEEPTEWFEDKDPLDGLDLLTAIIEVNASYFFDSANVERIKAAFARIEKVIEQHGGATSTSLSETSTDHSAPS